MSQPRVSNKSSTSSRRRKAFDPVEGLQPPTVQPSVPYGVYLQAYKDYLLFREHLLQEKWAKQANAVRNQVTVRQGTEVTKVVGPQGSTSTITFGTLVPVQTTSPLDIKGPVNSRVRPKHPWGIEKRAGRWEPTSEFLIHHFGVPIEFEEGEGVMEWLKPAPDGSNLPDVYTDDEEVRRLGARLAAEKGYDYEDRLLIYLKHQDGEFQPKLAPKKVAKAPSKADPPKPDSEKKKAKKEKRRRARANRKARREAQRLKDVKAEAEKLRAEARLVQAKVGVATATAKLEKVSGSTEIKTKPAAPKQPQVAGLPVQPPSEVRQAPAPKPNRKERRRGIFGPPRE